MPRPRIRKAGASKPTATATKSNAAQGEGTTKKTPGSPLKKELRASGSRGNLRSGDKSSGAVEGDDGRSTRGSRSGRKVGRELGNSSLNIANSSSRKSSSRPASVPGSTASKRSAGRKSMDASKDRTSSVRKLAIAVEIPSSPLELAGASTPKSKVQVPLSVTSSPMNSSQQENQSPPPSSPPAEAATPTQIRFRSSEGFTPPPPKTVTPERVRLEFDEDAGFTPPLPSARKPLHEVREPSPHIFETPSRTRRHNIWSDPDINSTPPSAQPQRDSPFFSRARNEDPGFDIFEDSCESAPAQSPASPPRRRGRKRLSDGSEKLQNAPVESDSGNLSDSLNVGEEDEVIEAEEEAPVRPKRRRKAPEAKKGHLATTAELQNLLPKRKNAAASKALYANIDSEGNSQDADESTVASVLESDEDELATTTRTHRLAAKKGKQPAKGRRKGAAATAKAAASTVKGKGTQKKTYSRKSLPAEEESEIEGDFADESLELITKEAKEKLKKEAEKFKEIDNWDLDFESVSGDTP